MTAPLDHSAASDLASQFNSKERRVNPLSVDVEDWFQVGAFERTIDRDSWDSQIQRVDRNTNVILDQFAAAGVQGTFFTLAWVAERNPALVKRIVSQGHELASHGYDHARVFTLDAKQFASDLKKSRDILENIGGVSVIGYRAPSFSIDARTPWAHAVLADHGYIYSSSVAPLKHDHYGWPGTPTTAWKPVAESDLIELPVTTAKILGKSIVLGGGFFRLLPYAVSRSLYRRTNAAGNPAILYFHPWEIDADQPYVANAPLKSRLRHYARLSAMAGKLDRLLGDFAWDRFDRLLPANVLLQSVEV
jgi:polysaccharide deacetylase family protein (PEP-CTERM system associated)